MAEEKKWSHGDKYSTVKTCIFQNLLPSRNLDIDTWSTPAVPATRISLLCFALRDGTYESEYVFATQWRHSLNLGTKFRPQTLSEEEEERRNLSGSARSSTHYKVTAMLHVTLKRDLSREVSTTSLHCTGTRRKTWQFRWLFYMGCFRRSRPRPPNPFSQYARLRDSQCLSLRVSPLLQQREDKIRTSQTELARPDRAQLK